MLICLSDKKGEILEKTRKYMKIKGFENKSLYKIEGKDWTLENEINHRRIADLYFHNEENPQMPIFADFVKDFGIAIESLHEREFEELR